MIDATEEYMILERRAKKERMTVKKIGCPVARSIPTIAFLILVGMTAWSGGIRLRVSAEQANIREKPDIASAVLKQVPEGAYLEAGKKVGEWYAVIVEDEEGRSTIGYVHESLVVVVEAARQEPSRQREPVETREPAYPKPVREKREEPRLPATQTPPAPAQTEKRERMAAVFWLGARRAAVGDLNEGAEGLARYYESRLSATSDGDIKELHSGYLLGAELRIPLASRFYFSFGAEHFSGEASSSVSYTGGSSEALYSTKPWIGITPVSLALVFYPLRFVYAKAGLDFTLASCSYFYRFGYPDPDEPTESWQEWKGEAGSSGFGYQLGLGLEWSLGSLITLIAEGAYRYSRIDDFEGEDFYQESSGYQSREEGTLYRISASAGGAETYPLVFIRNKKPTEAGVMDVRRAELDLSGYSLKLGLKISF